MSRSYNGHARRDYDTGDGIVIWNAKPKRFFKTLERRRARRAGKALVFEYHPDDHTVYEDELSYIDYDQDYYDDDRYDFDEPDFDDYYEDSDPDYGWDYYDPWGDY